MDLFSAPVADRREWQCVSFYQPSEEMKGKAVFPTGPPAGRAFDVIVANMTREPLKRVADHLSGCLAPGGFLAVSGLQESSVPEVVEAYAKRGIQLEVQFTESDGLTTEHWVCLAGRKAAA